MKTKATIIMLAVLALAGLFAVRANREADQTRAAIKALESQDAGMRAATASVEQRLRTASQALAQLEQKPGRPPGEPGAGAGAAANATAAGHDTAAKPFGPTRQLTATTIIANDPQKLAEYLQSYRGSLDLYYGDMFKALGLSAEQIEKLKDLNVWGLQQQMDLNAAMEVQGLDRNSVAYKELQAELSRTRMAKEKELLGDLVTPYREYQREYSRTQGVRDLAKELAGTAVYSGELMTSVQVERTTQILAANSQRGKPGYMSGYANPSTVNWLAARAQLQDVLSPTQIVALGEIVESKATQDKATERQNRLLAEFKAKQAAAKVAQDR